MINSPPYEVHLAVVLDVQLVEVPPLLAGSHALGASFPDLGREHRTEPVHQNRTVSWLTSIPCSYRRSSTFWSESGNRTYNIPAKRMMSELVLK